MTVASQRVNPLPFPCRASLEDCGDWEGRNGHSARPSAEMVSLDRRRQGGGRALVSSRCKRRRGRIKSTGYGYKREEVIGREDAFCPDEYMGGASTRGGQGLGIDSLKRMLSSSPLFMHNRGLVQWMNTHVDIPWLAGFCFEFCPLVLVGWRVQ